MSVKIVEERFVAPMTCGRCEHTWNYSGKNTYVATCPYCRTKLSIKKHNRLQQAQSLPTQGQIAAPEAPKGSESNG
jgi:DNA-directed RNA polymerase subunit RPC12/RpoP